MPPYPGETHNNADVEDVEDVEDVGLDNPAEDPHAAKPAGTTTAIGVAGYNIEMDSRFVPYVAGVVAAIILLVAILVPSQKGSQYRGYGISLSVIGMFFDFLGMCLVTRAEFYDSPLATLPVVGPVTYGGAIGQFLFVWWFIGACILTFDGPFEDTGNGYFSVWAGVFLAAMACGITADHVRSKVGAMGYTNGLLAASIVLIAAIIPKLGEGGQTTYALIIAILTIIMLLVFNGYPHMEYLRLPLFAIFAINWIVMACYLTFKGPFLKTGNGYFASWMGAILCTMAAASLRHNPNVNSH